MTTLSEVTEPLGPALSRALADKGYERLTAVQSAVLDPALAGRDLRVSSQTGSGKTIAIGFLLRALVTETCATQQRVARPRALIVAPTRELALQVEAELRWLFAHERGRVTGVTGGASYRDEHRALARGPAVVVGTPGRLLDHLRRGTIVPADVRAVVLDEADRMLDLGFRDEIEAIFGLLPAPRATHLVSATFARGVLALADAVQREPLHVHGTRLGAANTDIDHVVHIVAPREKLDAIVNLLLRYPDEQTLIFARTRAEVSELAALLQAEGFAASALSGDLDQSARNRTLAAFKRGALRVLVATEVAARGLDVQGVTRVIHAELPANPDAYTHRSGRTGRAGRRGVSALLVAPAMVVHATRLLRLSGVPHRFEPLPTPAEIRREEDARVVERLTAKQEGEQDRLDGRLRALATRLVDLDDPARTIARLLAHTELLSRSRPRELRTLSPIPAPPPRNGGRRGPRPPFRRR